MAQGVSSVWRGVTAKSRMMSGVSRGVTGMAMRLWLLAALLMPTVAWAQASELFPGPMSTPELAKYMDRIGISPQQQLAVDAMHDQYKREYRDLQEAEYAKFNEMMNEMESMFPQREDVNKLLDAMDRILVRARMVDERLFDQIQTMLTEEQLAVLPRVRLARERQRYMANQMMWNMGQAPVDMSEMYHQLELEPDVVEATDPLVFEYEHAITRDISKLYHLTSRLYRRIFDELEKAGFTAENMADPEQQMAMQEAMQDIFLRITEESRELTWKVHDQNKKLYTLLKQIMPETPGDRLRTLYYSEAYPQIGWLVQDSVLTARGDLDAVTNLTEQQQSRIDAELIAPAMEIDRNLEEIVKFLDEFARETTPFNYDASRWEEQNRMVSEFQQKASDFREKAWKVLSDILTPQQLGEYNTARHERMTGAAPNAVVAATIEANANSVVSEAEVAQNWGPDQFLAHEINSSDVRLYGHIMGLTDDQKAILNELHNAYMDAYRAYQKNSLQKLTAISRSLWYNEETGEYHPPTSEKIAAMYDARESTLATLRSIDENFFGDLSIAFGDTAGSVAIDRVRLLRERAHYNRGHWDHGQTSKAWAIDVVKFVLRVRLDDDQKQAIEPVIHEYEQQATALYRTMYEKAKRMQRVSDEWNSHMQRMQQDGNFNQAAWQEYQDRISAPSNELNSAIRALTKLNTSAFDRVLAKLDADTARTLRMTFRRVAYPQVYLDATSPMSQFDAALALESLTADQRSQLQEASLEYRMAYDALCDKLVVLYDDAGPNNYAVTDPEQVERVMKSREQAGRLEFDRRELNSRAIRRLKQVLSPDQISAIGGLPKIDA